jgi:hypothetical protein
MARLRDAYCQAVATWQPNRSSATKDKTECIFHGDASRLLMATFPEHLPGSREDDNVPIGEPTIHRVHVSAYTVAQMESRNTAKPAVHPSSYQVCVVPYVISSIPQTCGIVTLSGTAHRKRRMKEKGPTDDAIDTIHLLRHPLIPINHMCIMCSPLIFAPHRRARRLPVSDR